MDDIAQYNEPCSSEELKRQMINRAIDVLHKLVNKRIKYSESVAVMSKIVSKYYMIDHPDGLKDDEKLSLEVMINNSSDILDEVHEDKLNLYQAIMLINKVFAIRELKNGLSKEFQNYQKEEKIKPIKKDPPPFQPREEREETIDVFTEKMRAVIENKRKLKASIKDLNNELQAHGLSLNSLDIK